MERPMPSGPATAEPRYYAPSNQVGAGLYLWLPLFGGLGAVALGAVYAFLAGLVRELEAPYWLVIVTPFFAVGLAGLSWVVCYKGAVRQPSLRVPVALVIGALGLYASWHFYLNWLGGRPFHPWPTWRMGPAGVWRAMRQLAEYRGATSWVWWVLEAGVVLGGLGWLIGYLNPEIPYCEACGRWTDEVVRADLEDGVTESTVEQFRLGRVEPLTRVGPRIPGSIYFVRVRVHQCLGCREVRYACIDRVKVTPAKKGKGLNYGGNALSYRPRLNYDIGSPETENETPIVTNLAIDAAVHEKLSALAARPAPQPLDAEAPKRSGKRKRKDPSE